MGFVGTYNAKAKYPHMFEYNEEGGEPTYGGYSKMIVVDENFVLSVPTNLDLAAATPLLCAGITVYSPMMFYNLKPNERFAVAGLGGLGHMAVKFGVAMGCHVTVLSTSEGKKETALKMGAHAFVNMKDKEQVGPVMGSFDFILNTIAADHDIETYMHCLKAGRGARCVLVGVPPNKVSLHAFSFVASRKLLVGSLIGGTKETQEMLDFCGLHNITCDVEKIDPTYVNEAWDRTVKSDVKYRFVIDCSKM
jgi:uncharacterized zinc-type alcohol dehydrogenase-like protein